MFVGSKRCLSPCRGCALWEMMIDDSPSIKRRPLPAWRSEEFQHLSLTNDIVNHDIAVPNSEAPTTTTATTTPIFPLGSKAVKQCIITFRKKRQLEQNIRCARAKEEQDRCPDVWYCEIIVWKHLSFEWTLETLFYKSIEMLSICDVNGGYIGCCGGCIWRWSTCFVKESMAQIEIVNKYIVICSKGENCVPLGTSGVWKRKSSDLVCLLFSNC